MKKYLLIILILAGCEVAEPIVETKPLNGIWQSVKIDETSPYILVEMHLLEILQYNNGSVYGGIIEGSGGFDFAHWWVEFEIVSGISDRIRNNIRMTFDTEWVYVNGQMVRSTGRFEGKIFEDKLTGTFQLNELGIAFPLVFIKMN